MFLDDLHFKEYKSRSISIVRASFVEEFLCYLGAIYHNNGPPKHIEIENIGIYMTVKFDQDMEGIKYQIYSKLEIGTCKLTILLSPFYVLVLRIQPRNNSKMSDYGFTRRAWR